MNAIKLYVSTARLVLENDTHDISICKEITATFPSLEQSLTCTVCRNLLTDPYSPTETSCQHHVCKACVGGHKKLRPSCSWCKDYSKYVKNNQLQCLLVCYKGLCEYMKCTNLLTQLTDLFPTFNDSDKNIQSIVQKGIELPYGNKRKDSKSSCEAKVHKDYESYSLKRDSNFGAMSPNNSDINDSSFLEVDRLKEPRSDRKSDSAISPVSSQPDDVSKLNDITDDLSEGRGNSSYAESVTDSIDKPVYSVSFVGTRSKLILKRRTATTRREVRRDRGYEQNDVEQLPVSHSLRTSDYSSQNTSTNESRFRKSKPKPIVSADRPNCRCGNATPRPGKLTCCGQRCACYMQSKACTGCRCRGCRNPHMFDGVKVLGRFMKDDQQSNLAIGDNSSTFQELSTNFLNQQISYILPADLPGTVLNIS